MPVENRLLAAIPSEVKARLEPNLERVSLPFKEVLYESRELIEYVYFPIHGVISLLTIVEECILAEVGLVGNEGMVGLSVFLGIEATPFKAIVQVPGEAMRMKADVFKDLVNADSPLYSLLLPYTHALMFQIAQSAACNSYHSVEKRCCRWLLTVRGRVHSDQFPLTHEFLSTMLGVRRASVSVVAAILQQAGFIYYRRGKIKILDREGLESASCECYQAIKQESDRLLG